MTSFCVVSFEVSSDVMDNEDNSVKRNENKVYKTGMSNITNIDKIEESKGAMVSNNCVKKNSVDNRNSWDAKLKAKRDIQRFVDELLWFLKMLSFKQDECGGVWSKIEIFQLHNILHREISTNWPFFNSYLD